MKIPFAKIANFPIVRFLNIKYLHFTVLLVKMTGLDITVDDRHH